MVDCHKFSSLLWAFLKCSILDIHKQTSTIRTNTHTHSFSSSSDVGRFCRSFFHSKSIPFPFQLSGTLVVVFFILRIYFSYSINFTKPNTNIHHFNLHWAWPFVKISAAHTCSVQKVNQQMIAKAKKQEIFFRGEKCRITYRSCVNISTRAWNSFSFYSMLVLLSLHYLFYLLFSAEW